MTYRVSGTSQQASDYLFVLKCKGLYETILIEFCIFSFPVLREVRREHGQLVAVLLSHIEEQVS